MQATPFQIPHPFVQQGDCGFCKKPDRPIVHLKSAEGTLDGFFCVKCLVSILEAHMPRKVEPPVALAAKVG